MRADNNMNFLERLLHFSSTEQSFFVHISLRGYIFGPKTFRFIGERRAVSVCLFGINFCRSLGRAGLLRLVFWSQHVFGDTVVIIGAIAFRFVLKDGFAVAWCFRQFDVSPDVYRNDFGIGPRAIGVAGVAEEFVDIIFYFRRQCYPCVEHAQ